MRRSRRARRWTLSIPWGAPPLLTVPTWMPNDEIEQIIEAHRQWIADERAKQRPRLRLDPRGISEIEARRAVRELVSMLIEEEARRARRHAAADSDSRPALALGLVLDVRARCPSTGGSCSRRSTCSTTSSCTSSATCESRTTRAASGRSSRTDGPTGGSSATGCTSTGPSYSRSAPPRR